LYPVLVVPSIVPSQRCNVADEFFHAAMKLNLSEPSRCFKCDGAGHAGSSCPATPAARTAFRQRTRERFITDLAFATKVRAAVSTRGQSSASDYGSSNSRAQSPASVGSTRHHSDSAAATAPIRRTPASE